jgi:predicted dehydrogenase
MRPSNPTRREFLKTASTGALALSLNASTHARAQGANDRIRIGIIGCGDRGQKAHMPGIHKHAEEQNAEFVAVCDPWRQRREEAAAKVKEWHGREATQFSSYRELLAMDDLDAVMIASCDHQHTTHLEAVAEAGKDVYCEKPLGMDFEAVKSACAAVKRNNIVAQVGTQLRSMPSFTGVRDFFRTGALGRISRIEQRRNAAKPYWYAYLHEVREEDVDWREFLMDRPMRPFNPVLYTGWYGYRDFSDGPVCGFGSHFLDLIHYITGAEFPTSAVSLSGTFTWKDENNFTCPDHAQAEWIYPEGFLATYSTNFGNGAGNCFKIHGENGTLDLVKWDSPILSKEGALKDSAAVEDRAIEDTPRPDHFLDWLQCLRSRKTPNASIEAGYQHAVACLMAIRAGDTGQRQVYDREKREILAG